MKVQCYYRGKQAENKQVCVESYIEMDLYKETTNDNLQ